MAKTKFNPKSLANLHPVKKGEVRNPLGGNTAGHRMWRLTQKAVFEIGELILQNDLETLQKVAQKKDASVLEVWIASVAVRAIKVGDASALDTLLNRFIGKVPNQVILRGTMHTHRAPVDLKKLSPEDLDELEKILSKADPDISMALKSQSLTEIATPAESADLVLPEGSTE